MNDLAIAPGGAGKGEPWVRDVTRDAVRHFAWGIGDNNPLWLDPDYAEHSPQQTLLAPPCFTYALHETTVAPGFDDRQRIYQDVNWVWFDTIRLGATLTTHAELIDTVTQSSGVVQTGQTTYRDPNGGIVAQATAHCLRPSHRLQVAREAPEPKYAEAELVRIEQAILGETRRGCEPRKWETTTLGDPLGPLTKGPLSIMDIVAWCAGALGVPDTDGHQSTGGLSEEVATGPQLTAWCGQLVTDWLGDHGFLHRLEVELAEQPGLGSTTVLQGAVTQRWVDGLHNLVQVRFTATGRQQQPVATGLAVVGLPSNEHPVALPPKRTIEFREAP